MKAPQQEDSNITVAIRIRPLSVKQQNSGDQNIIRVQDNLIIVLDPLDMDLEDKKVTDVLHRSKQQRYAFDKIYRNQSSEAIYAETVQSLIKTVLKGYNSTVFAYGPTGTGKTYTMLGNQEVYGLNILAIRDIFETIEGDQQNNYEVVITYVQIYNEMIRDLLVPASGYLQLRDDPQKGIVIAGVTEFKAQSTEQVLNLLLIGNRRRTTEATNANQTSSRSHAVFQINVSRVSKTKNTTIQSLVGKLSLIDLAGSQRGTVTQNRGIRLMQGAKINRSLLALANCINALGDKNKKGFFVPYRDSKLTRLLKDSLGGNCKTVMIVNISPSSAQFEETINTLKYANRAKNIKTKALSNKKLVALHISEYKNIINDLRREIDELKQRLNDRGINELDSIQNRQKLPRIQSRHGKPPPPPNLSGGGGSTNACSCGRLQQKQDIRMIKQQIFQNFNQRIQLRRAMMQIEQQNAMNILQIRKKQGEILLLKKMQGWQQNDSIMQQIKQLTKLISTLKLSTNKNKLKKQISNLQIMQSMTNMKKIKEEINKRIKIKQNRDLLQIIIKNHVLELQNIQLELNLQIQEKMISDMKAIITTQKGIIQEHNITVELDDDVLLDDIQLQLDDDEDFEQDEGNDDDDDLYNNLKILEVNRKLDRNKSAKKQQDKRKIEDFPFKKKQREKTLQKQKAVDFGLKGLNLKMNIRKKK